MLNAYILKEIPAVPALIVWRDKKEVPLECTIVRTWNRSAYGYGLQKAGNGRMVGMRVKHKINERRTQKK